MILFIPFVVPLLIIWVIAFYISRSLDERKLDAIAARLHHCLNIGAPETASAKLKEAEFIEKYKIEYRQRAKKYGDIAIRGVFLSVLGIPFLFAIAAGLFGSPTSNAATFAIGFFVFGIGYSLLTLYMVVMANVFAFTGGCNPDSPYL